MKNLLSTEIGAMLFYVINTFNDGIKRIASSLSKKVMYIALVLLAPLLQFFLFLDTF